MSASVGSGIPSGLLLRLGEGVPCVRGEPDLLRLYWGSSLYARGSVRSVERVRDVPRCEDTECAFESRELRDSGEEPRDEALDDSLTERHEPLELDLAEHPCECVLGEGGSSTRPA